MDRGTLFLYWSLAVCAMNLIALVIAAPRMRDGAASLTLSLFVTWAWSAWAVYLVGYGRHSLIFGVVSAIWLCMLVNSAFKAIADRSTLGALLLAFEAAQVGSAFCWAGWPS